MEIRKDSSVRILVADDNELIRNAVCSLLQSRAGWSICGEAGDGREAVKMTIELNPDVVLVDISMPHLNGFETAKHIHENAPHTQVLVVTEHDSRTLACLPSQVGVRGYVIKSRIDSDLIQAVEAAIRHLPVSLSPQQKPRAVAV